MVGGYGEIEFPAVTGWKRFGQLSAVADPGGGVLLCQHILYPARGALIPISTSAYPRADSIVQVLAGWRRQPGILHQHGQCEDDKCSPSPVVCLGTTRRLLMPSWSHPYHRAPFRTRSVRIPKRSSRAPPLPPARVDLAVTPPERPSQPHRALLAHSLALPAGHSCS